MAKTPQVLITLSPLGNLQVELPGISPTRRTVILTDREAVATIKRILYGQLADKAEIGEDGAPTIAQVRHWEKHEVFSDSSCRFCIAEGRTFGPGRPKRAHTIRKDSEVEISRISIKRFDEVGRKLLRLEDLED